MIELALYWLGVAVASVGAVGVLAVVATWATNQLLEFTGMAKIIMHWYADRLTRQRDTKRSGA